METTSDDDFDRPMPPDDKQKPRNQSLSMSFERIRSKSKSADKLEQQSPSSMMLSTDTSSPKAVTHHFQCFSLSIGSWLRINQRGRALIVFFSPEKRCVTYYFEERNCGFKIEYPFAYIKNIGLRYGSVGSNNVALSPGLTVELNHPPNFFESSTHSKKPYHCNDFTDEQQASDILVHYLVGDPKVLIGQLKKLVSLESFRSRHNLYSTSELTVSTPNFSNVHLPFQTPQPAPNWLYDGTKHHLSSAPPFDAAYMSLGETQMTIFQDDPVTIRMFDYDASTSVSSSIEWDKSDNRHAVAAKCGITGGHKTLSPGFQDSLIVCGHLGHGSLGVVEEVRVSKPGFQTFVRKRVQLRYHQRKKRLQIIQEEARVLEDLCHPHIVQLLGSYTDLTQQRREFYCLLMSPVGENDLKTFLEEVGERKPTIAERRWLWSWFSCLTSALAYIHGEGIRHQDIKPLNIIHRGSQIFFTDFSSSSRFTIGQTTSTENPARTSAMYAAPEVIENMGVDGTLRKHGRGTDIFSLGCVFSEMFTVCLGFTVDEFHSFLLEQPHAGKEGAAALGKVLLYSRVTARVAHFFRGLDWYDVYIQRIAPMIRFNREDRPDAHGMMQNYFKPCQCNNLNRPSDQKSTRTGQDASNSVSDSWRTVT